MKNFEDTSLAKNQCQDAPTLRSSQIAVIFILVSSSLIMGIYGNLILSVCLGILVSTVALKHYIDHNIYNKYSITAISRFMAESQFPNSVQVQVNCMHKQKYVVLSTQKPVKTTVLIIDIINPDLLNLHQMHQELKHYANHQIEVYMIIDGQWEGAEELKKQLEPYISIYNIYNLLDNCLVHLKGKLEKMASISV